MRTTKTRQKTIEMKRRRCKVTAPSKTIDLVQSCVYERSLVEYKEHARLNNTIIGS